MMNCRQFGEQNRKSRMGAQLKCGVVAQQREMAAQEVRQEEAGEELVVHTHIFVIWMFLPCKKIVFSAKNAENREYVEYS
jgi:hypothetical protein